MQTVLVFSPGYASLNLNYPVSANLDEREDANKATLNAKYAPSDYSIEMGPNEYINTKNIKGLNIRHYKPNNDFRFEGENGVGRGAYLEFYFSDSRLDQYTKVAQWTMAKYGDRYEMEWDNSNLSPYYPFAYDEGNHTWSFSDEPGANYYKNGDYFHAIVYFYNTSENILRLEWGYKVINNKSHLEYLNAKYYK